MKTFEILFSDLTESAQKELCNMFNTTPEEENWEYIPIAHFDREVLIDEDE